MRLASSVISGAKTRRKYCARARCVLQNAKCEALDVVGFGCLLDDRHEGFEVPSDLLGFLPKLRFNVVVVAEKYCRVNGSALAAS